MTNKKRLLLVEDDVFGAETLKYALEAKGHEVIMATNGREALSIVRKRNPQLVVLDIMMPKMDGYHFCRLVKFDTRYKHIPVIFVSSKIQEADKKLGFTCGGDEYITKPYDINHLVTLVDKYLESIEEDSMSTSNQGEAPQSGTTATPEPGVPPQDGSIPTPNHGEVSQDGMAPTSGHGEASQGGMTPTSGYGEASQDGSTPTPNHGEVSQDGMTPTPNYGEASQDGSTPTPSHGEAFQGGMAQTSNQGEASHGGTTPTPEAEDMPKSDKQQTMMTGETSVIGENAKITVLNIGSEQVKICLNDSAPVTFYMNETKSINEDIKIKIIKIDLDLVDLEIVVSDKLERSKKWFF